MPNNYLRRLVREALKKSLNEFWHSIVCYPDVENPSIVKTEAINGNWVNVKEVAEKYLE